MTATDFPAFYEQQRQRVEQALNEWLPPEDQKPAELNEAMRYSVFNGGKRLRGVLVLEAGQLGDSDPSVLEALSAVIEMIHAYSLIHDDLPAMDDDDYRRGKPSNHKTYGEDIAILAGDALLTRAFEVIAQLSELGLDPARVVDIQQRVGSDSGGQGLIGGQVLDLNNDNGNPDLETLKNIHEWKTGALISLSLQMGGIAANLSEEQIRVLDQFGVNLGLAFQIKDDLLDVTGDLDTLGKDPESDVDGDKLTYPSLLGVDGAKEALGDVIEECHGFLDDLGSNRDHFEQLIDLIANRNH